MVEPWLRGTLTEVDAVRRQVLHALELAEEDCARWGPQLSEEEMNLRPFGMASVGFHRLLTYAEGRGLNESQLTALRSEMVGEAPLEELKRGIERARQRVMAILPETFQEARTVGRDALPTSVGGLLVHCAEHTQRHVGQVVSTAQVVIGMREG